ncbi:MAG TPA: lysophospholipid acyltransferase family protein [Chthoniobacter sp.]|nr:lysophospholipid acyltransferase family protein [Chthoniobacter sp.]
MRDSLYTIGGFKFAFSLAHLLPRAVNLWLATRIGLAAYQRSPEAQAALRSNLHLVTGLQEAKLDALCKTNVGNFSRMLADYFICAGPNAAKKAAALLHLDGGEQHLAAARAPGKGVIVVTGHLGHWELGGLMLALLGLPLTVVTLEEPSSELTRWREASRRQLGIKTITVGPTYPFAFVEMMQTLRRNELVAMLVDRPYEGSGACVELFGHKTEFSTAAALLAQHTGASVLPAFVIHDGQDGYQTMAEPPVPMEMGGDPKLTLPLNTQRIATVFEDIIRRHPDQWFNYVPIWKEKTHEPDPQPAQTS